MDLGNKDQDTPEAAFRKAQIMGYAIMAGIVLYGLVAYLLIRFGVSDKVAGALREWTGQTKHARLLAVSLALSCMILSLTARKFSAFIRACFSPRPVASQLNTAIMSYAICETGAILALVAAVLTGRFMRTPFRM